MRPIKFRAWDKEEKKFTYYEVPEMVGCWDIDTLDKKLELSTGLKDKNGKEIYEGDIVEYLFYGYKNPNRQKVVEWTEYSRNGVGFNISKVKTGGHEVIGNIYENPELLEG